MSMLMNILTEQLNCEWFTILTYDFFKFPKVSSIYTCGRQRQAYLNELEASLVNIAIFRPVKATWQDSFSKKKM